jgi:hypothetical protein
MSGAYFLLVKTANIDWFYPTTLTVGMDVLISGYRWVEKFGKFAGRKIRSQGRSPWTTET